MDALGINVGYLLVQIIAFIVIYALMTRFMYDPLMNALRTRRQTIAKGLEDAAAAANARQNAEAEAEKILAQARTEAAQIVEEGRTRGETVAQQVEAEARKAAEGIREAAQKDAESARDTELAGLRGQVAAIASALSQQLIGATLDEKRQKALVNDFFAKVPADAKSLSGSVQVVSAMPLNDAEQKKVQKEIGADAVNFVVDPNILGGLIVRSGDRVVDGSVRRGLSELSGRLS